jgi:N-acetylglutamate synthase-like GNAT family acetyltransferase
MILEEIRPEDIENAVKCIRRAVQISNALDYPANVIKTQLEQHYTLEWMKKAVKNRYCVVAKEGSEVWGTGSLAKNELRNIFVDPDYQNQGIGKQIVQHLEKKAMEKGFGEVWLVSSITAHDFYKQMDYRDVEEVQERIGDDVVTGYLMKKTITKSKGFCAQSLT